MARSTLDMLVDQLKIIRDDCADVIELGTIAGDMAGPSSKDAEAGGGSASGFDGLRKRVHHDLKVIRENLFEREELLGGADRAGAAHINAKVRRKIEDVRDKAEKMAKMHDKAVAKAEKKKNISNEEQQQLDDRTEMIDFIYQHIEEVETIMHAREDMDDEDDIGDGVTIARGGGESTVPSGKQILHSKLPSIDVDEGRMLQDKNQEVIDSELDKIRDQVSVLGEKATIMGDEVKAQNKIIDQIDKDVDKVNVELNTLNKQLKETLDKVAKGDRFVMYFIMLCVVLGLAGVIYTVVSKNLR